MKVSPRYVVRFTLLALITPALSGAILGLLA